VASSITSTSRCCARTVVTLIGAALPGSDAAAADNGALAAAPAASPRGSLPQPEATTTTATPNDLSHERFMNIPRGAKPQSCYCL
jgi:hypothetical protein